MGIRRGIDSFLCVWCRDAFYQFVDAEGVRRGLTSLRDAGTPATMLILDDGWQTVSDETDDEARSADDAQALERALAQECVLNDPSKGEGSNAWHDAVGWAYRKFVHNAPHNAPSLRVHPQPLLR